MGERELTCVNREIIRGRYSQKERSGCFVIYYNDIYPVVSLWSNVGNVSKYIAIRSAVLSFCLIFKCAVCHFLHVLAMYIQVYTHL